MFVLKLIGELILESKLRMLFHTAKEIGIC